MHFGYDHAADDKHLHAGLIALDPATGALAAWQPSAEQLRQQAAPGVRDGQLQRRPPGHRDQRRRALLRRHRRFRRAGDRLDRRRSQGDTRCGGAARTATPWRVAVTHDRVYLVGHFDHAVADPNDPCLDIGPLPDGGNGVLCDQETPSRHLVAWDVRGEIDSTGRTPARPSSIPSFTAQANTSEGPYNVHLGANRMYVGGNFTEVANAPVASGGCADSTSRASPPTRRCSSPTHSLRRARLRIKPEAGPSLRQGLERRVLLPGASRTGNDEVPAGALGRSLGRARGPQ